MRWSLWGTRPNDVVMFHVGRCGSTVVGDLLGQHPEITWRGEYFNDWNGPRNPAVAMARLGISNRRCRTPIFGFEIKFLDVQHPWRIGSSIDYVVRVLRRRRYRRWIVLERVNHLQRLVSHIAAFQDRIYHVGPETETPSPRVRLPLEGVPVGSRVASLREWIEVTQSSYERLRRMLPAGTLELTYEDDVEEDPRLAYRQICDYLAIESHPTQIRLGRTGGEALSRRLENYAEVRDELAGTRWEWMLEE